MCVDPVTLAATTALLSAASTGLEFVGGRQQAEAEREAAALEFSNDFNTLNARALEVNMQESGEVFNSAIERTQQGGAIAVGAAEGGLSTVTQSRLVQTANAATGRNLTTARQQADLQIGQIGREIGAAATRRDVRQASARGPGIPELLLGLTGSALAGANSFNAATAASASGA